MSGTHQTWSAAFDELKTGLTLDSSYVKARRLPLGCFLELWQACAVVTGATSQSQVVLEVEQHMQLLKRQSRVRIEQWLRKLAEKARHTAPSFTHAHFTRCSSLS